ncbi:MAG: hypothetical protein ACHQ17_05540 [Polyangia bacterium]
MRLRLFALACVLALPTVAQARGPEPAGRDAQILGRVFERGSINPIAGVRITTSAKVSAVSGSDGRFTLDLPPGPVELVLTDENHEPLKVTETLEPGKGIVVEYRLLPRQHRRYQSTVRGEARHVGERFTLENEELHQMPGGLGDPFRAIGAMPGVATPLPLLPLYVVRGASPGMNGFFLDGMRVPQLFHFLLLGGVVHPELIDRLDFYPGAYDVSFGRYAGGVIDAETRPARSDGQHGMVELRLYDISALAEFNLPKGVKVEVAGHYGYPSFIIHAIDPRVDLQYGDYQLRIDWRGLTVEALGSYDSLAINDPQLSAGLLPRGAPNDLTLQFHRIQIRERDRVGRWALEAALVGGYDEMATFGGSGVHKLSLGWRFNAKATWRRFRLYAGTDGELSQFTAESFDAGMGASAPDAFGDLSGNRNGIVAGAFVESTVDIVPRRLEATVGVRADVYHANAVTLLGIDPRMSLKATLLPWLALTGGIGVYQQPPSFPVALPGIDTFALQLGLQRAYQGAVGIEATLPKDFSFKVTGYYEKFENVNDVVLDFGPAICTSPPPESLTGLPATITRQVNGESYGMELLLRRKLGRVTGWISYTLGRADRVYSCGLRPADFDQTHLLNVVLQVRLPWHLMVGSRLYVATGRPVTLLDETNPENTIRNNTRLPDYVQLDLRIDREWIFKKWALSAFLEVLNLTYSESDFGLTYPMVNGVPLYNMPMVNGFHWILPSVGVRGRF